jgi:glycosyltransferase involved in cell wall biosynthesis
VRIVHALAQPVPQSVDGCSNAVWTLATAQAALGHEVCVVVQSAIGPAATHESGLRLVGWSDRAALRRVRSWADVLHLYSAFSPRLVWVQAALAGAVPIVASPQGGLAAPVLARRPARKRAYGWTIERRRLRAAELLVALTAAEADDLGRYLGPRRPPIAVMSNPIAPVSIPAPVCRQPGRVVYLGRFDVQHKGLDRLAAVARHSQAEFHLYGPAGGGGAMSLPGLAAGNLVVHGPVFGAAKTAVLGRAAVYVQPSRWEAFGCSIAEAAMAGTPLVVSSSCDLAVEVVRNGCGIAVDFEQTRAAAAALDRLLSSDSDGERAAMGQRAAQWAIRSFSAPVVARRAVEMYEALPASSGRRRWR